MREFTFWMWPFVGAPSLVTVTARTVAEAVNMLPACQAWDFRT
jgi:hypothetical protein